VQDASFDRPRPEAIGINPICNRNGYILVPRHLPIGIARFIEENPANYESLIAKDSPNETQQWSRFGEFPEGSNIEKIADAASTLFGDRIFFGQPLQGSECRRTDKVLLDVEAALFQLSTIDVFLWQAWPSFCWINVFQAQLLRADADVDTD
jgi:hypothetical protein